MRRPRIRGTTRELDERAQQLRAMPTQAEAVLWEALRGRGVDGFKFRRQHPLGSLILDFCCVSERLVIEVDGDDHRSRRAHDAERDHHLKQHGYRVIRFTNERVLNALPDVIETVRHALREPSR